MSESRHGDRSGILQDQLRLAVRELIRLADRCRTCCGSNRASELFQVFTLTDDPRRLMSPGGSALRLLNDTAGPRVHELPVTAIVVVHERCPDCRQTLKVIEKAGGFPLSVSRGTDVAGQAGAPTIRRLGVPKEIFRALEFRDKTQHRFVVEPRNSVVRPGSFAGLDLESGRARITEQGVELRARCRFDSGDVRAVSVTPIFKPGDLFWLVMAGQNLAASRYTLEVRGVRVARLQDMSYADAWEECVSATDHAGLALTPRENFARLWNHRRRGTHYWRTNPWVWLLLLATHRENIRAVFDGRYGDYS